MPAPLAMPPTATTPPGNVILAARCLGRVSVVMMAFAAALPFSADRSSATMPRPGTTLSSGNWTPMTPVDRTKNCSGRQSNSPAAARCISRAAFIPCFPVQALAIPAFATIPRMPARLAANVSRSRMTGDATTWFWVKTAAAVQSASERMSARSRLPDSLSPQLVAPAWKPRGVVTDPSVMISMAKFELLLVVASGWLLVAGGWPLAAGRQPLPQSLLNLE